MAQKNVTRDMTQGSPLKLILTFSLPLLGGFLFQQLYSFMDTMVVGGVLGTEALAAVGGRVIDRTDRRRIITGRKRAGEPEGKATDPGESLTGKAENISSDRSCTHCACGSRSRHRNDAS